MRGENMPKRITLGFDVSAAELEQRYRQSKNGIESRQFHVLWLLAQGQPTEKVSEITGYSRNWIYQLVRKYHQEGIESMGDGRRFNQGSNQIINDVEQAQLWQVLQGAAPDGGLWNGKKVADWLSELKGEAIHRQRGWEILRQMTFRLRVPRPAHHGSSAAEQEAWKKNCQSN
jgi:transposase